VPVSALIKVAVDHPQVKRNASGGGPCDYSSSAD